MKKSIEEIRKDFPILKEQIYFDNAATTHKPLSVLEAVRYYNQTFHANPHRGAYRTSVLATEAYENVRKKVQLFMGAEREEEIVFTRGATEAINLVARSFSEGFIHPGDEICLTIAEHHSNLVPWQWVARNTGATIKYLYIDQQGRLDMEAVAKTISERTRLVGIVHVSNVLGTIFPVQEVARIAHEKGALVLVDGSQSVPHMPVRVQALDADFFVFSGHKLYGPTGTGVLYGKQELLASMPPFLFGGNMIEYVTEQETTFAPTPNKFEAGTQNIEGVIGLGAAIDYVLDLGLSEIAAYEKELTMYAMDKMQSVPFVQIQGSLNAIDRSSVISFTIEGVHPHDVATILDSEGIAVRAGHHCAQPLMQYLGLPATNRVSFSFYNTKQEIDYFVEKLKTVRKWLGYGAE